MKLRSKRHTDKRLKGKARPTVIHIGGLYLVPEPEEQSLLDFVRMITHAIKPERQTRLDIAKAFGKVKYSPELPSGMNENLTPEQKEIEVKKEMAMHLDAFFRVADVEMESVRYYEETDAFRFKRKNGYAFLVSAAKRGTNNFLTEVFGKLKDWAEYASKGEGILEPKRIFGNIRKCPE
jgi:hypothetical protein